MSYFRHYVDIDGYGDTCLFRVYDGNEDNPQPILRLIDLPETARFLWPIITEGVGA